MGNDRRWLVWLGLALVGASAVLYGVHYLIFRDVHHIFIYLLGDIAFVPVEVLMVTLILHRLLEVREKRTLLRKLNMVIGAFFSEVGRPLINRIIAFDADTSALRDVLLFRTDWSTRDFARARSSLETYDYRVDAKLSDLGELRDSLGERRGFMLGLLQNPNLLEHESFTQLLWAVLHLQEELDARTALEGLPAVDLQHLSGDIQRAYQHLLLEWLGYMDHLSRSYPYLYSLAVRQNPFDTEARAEIEA